MARCQVSKLLLDDYDMLSRYMEGKAVKMILNCTENNISMLMEDGIIIDFSNLEDEIIFDIRLPASSDSN
ncbi:hypothetical protein [Syntrophomonas curvata]